MSNNSEDSTDKPISLGKFIEAVKHDLVTTYSDDAEKLFMIDEIIVEASFVITGEVDGKLDLKVVQLGSKVSEERIQKASIRLTPIISREDRIKQLEDDDAAYQQAIEVAKITLRGGKSSDTDETPPR